MPQRESTMILSAGNRVRSLGRGTDRASWPVGDTGSGAGREGNVQDAAVQKLSSSP
jgi:hypothetical protein